jgi:SAM-dependent methyltransferase
MRLEGGPAAAFRLECAPMRLYGELAPWFHLLTHPSEYADEAAYYTRVIEQAHGGRARTLLELGSGGGNNASHLKARFECTLTDVSAEMLELSKTLNPECEHAQGDMRTIRLGRTFDAVFVHDAVMYMTTEEDLRAVVETAAVHAAPGGVVVLVPDTVRETFAPGTDHGGHDGPDGRSLRYLEWTHAAEPDGTIFEVDFAIMLREPGAQVRVVHDHHEYGVFDRATWRRLVAEAGLDLVDVSGIPHPHPGEFETFAARRRA